MKLSNFARLMTLCVVWVFHGSAAAQSFSVTNLTLIVNTNVIVVTNVFVNITTNVTIVTNTTINAPVSNYYTNTTDLTQHFINGPVIDPANGLIQVIQLVGAISLQCANFGPQNPPITLHIVNPNSFKVLWNPLPTFPNGDGSSTNRLTSFIIESIAGELRATR